MEFNKLGNTLDISIIGFGGIPIQRVSYQEAAELLQIAKDQGLNFIDTARGYASSEEKIGYALEQVGGGFIIASKSMARDAHGFKKELNQSLSNLRTESIDLYQFHNVSTDDAYQQIMEAGGAYEAAIEAQNAGLIKHLGFTSHKPHLAKKAVESGKFISIQIPFNAVEDQFLEVIRMAADRNIATIIMKPLAGGAISTADLALRYILQFNVTTVIPGMQNASEVTENANVGNNVKPLTAVEQEKLFEQAKLLGDRFCRRCEYCLPCPQGIKIPTMFIFDGYYSRYNLQEWARERYWTQPATAVDCQDCGLCETRCPYQLPIRQMLKEVVEHFDQSN